MFDESVHSMNTIHTSDFVNKKIFQILQSVSIGQTEVDIEKKKKTNNKFILNCLVMIRSCL